MGSGLQMNKKRGFWIPYGHRMFISIPFKMNWSSKGGKMRSPVPIWWFAYLVFVRSGHFVFDIFTDISIMLLGFNSS